MKKILIFLCLFNIVSNAAAQVKIHGKESIKTEKRTKSFGIKGVAEYNELTNNGFGTLNNVLEKSQLNTLPGAFNVSGLDLILWESDKTAFEFGWHTMKAQLETTDKFVNSGIPLLTGLKLKATGFTQIYKRKKWTIYLGVGVSANQLYFKIIDLQPQLNNFSNLLTNPALSRAIEYQSDGIGMFEGCTGFDYATKFLKNERRVFTLGMRFGYAYQLLKSKKYSKWTARYTKNEIKDFPLVNLDNYFIQFNAAFNFNLN